MTKDEILKLEAWIVETKDEPRRDETGVARARESIRFTPEIMLYHDGSAAQRFDLRVGLADYLRRIAAYLEA